MSRLVEDFARDGVVCLRGVIPPDLVDLLRRGVDANIAHPTPCAKVARRADDPGRFVEDFCNWPENAAYRQSFFRSRLGELPAGAPMGHPLFLILWPRDRSETMQ